MIIINIQGYHLLWPNFPDGSNLIIVKHWPGPRSLATTNGVSIDVLSSGYLDVSVHQVSFLYRMINLQLIGFPHSEIFDSKVICT